MIPLLVTIGKFIHFISQLFNMGNGGTWPGEMALSCKPDILYHFTCQLHKGLVVVAGTNGKTTTSKMIKKIIADAYYSGRDAKIIHNSSGANLLNGLVSSFIKDASLVGEINADYAVLEVDENTLPSVISNKGTNTKIIIVILNLFRDQLDRYGEVDIIASKWRKALEELPHDSTVILNADDPQIAFLGRNLKSKVTYFGINRTDKYLPRIEHATDSTYCRNCGNKLSYKGLYFSHLGIWRCDKCGNRRPKPDIENYTSPLPGLYNEYNCLAAVSVAKSLGLEEKMIKTSLVNFKPAFGRQEEFDIRSKKIKMFLSKNPAGFNASLKTVLDLKPKILLLVLNDRIPDGRDVSWIWDVDFEIIPKKIRVIVSGDRAYDMGLRVKYARKQLIVEKDLKKAITKGLDKIGRDEILYILPTYSAMLEVRKILIGRKIL